MRVKTHFGSVAKRICDLYGAYIYLLRSQLQGRYNREIYFLDLEN